MRIAFVVNFHLLHKWAFRNILYTYPFFRLFFQAAGGLETILVKSPTLSSSVSREALQDLVAGQAHMESHEKWSSGGRHKLQSNVQKHLAQRSNSSEDTAYTTSAKRSRKVQSAQSIEKELVLDH